ncbi:MAG: methyltransferase [Geobacteraceae bacterium]|nr:methyltransferase [Geobacteraceae bacterium]
MDRSSKNRLTEKLLPQFPGDGLFDRVARAVCRAGCLPRKELYEAWEVARRVRRRFRGGRVVDLACGHGLLAHLLLLLDDSSPASLAVDRHIPESAARLAAALEDTWPRLQGRVRLVQAELESIPLKSDDLVVSVHACGGLTDLVLERAMAAGARVAVLPCCHNLDNTDLGGLQGWLDGPLAQDIMRAGRLRAAGYRVMTGQIPGDITPKNRLLMAETGRTAVGQAAVRQDEANQAVSGITEKILKGGSA